MSDFTGDGIRVTAQDLSSISPDSVDDNRMFHHDGSSALPQVGGGTSSTRGYYTWDADASAWFQLFQNADKLDGKDAGDFLQRDGSLAMQAALDVGNFNLINIGEAKGGSGGIHLNTNHVEIHSHDAGKNIHLKDSNDLLIAEAIEGGSFNVPNGTLTEQGNRVATRSWTQANADVPNADYSDDAGALGGNAPSSYLSVSGDQMEGPLDLGSNDLNDGGSVLYDSSGGFFKQTVLENDSITVNAGTGLLSGGSVALGGSVTLDVDDSRYVMESGDSMSGNLDMGGNLIESTSDPLYRTTRGSYDTLTWWRYQDKIGIYNETDSQYLLRVSQNGDVNADVGTLSEQGNRVATRTWTDSKYDYDSYPLSIAVSKWANGLSDVEIHRVELSAGEQLEVHRLEVQPRGGGDVTGLDVDVYDETNATVLASTSDVATGSPIATSGDGASVIVRLSNSSGSSQNASVGGQLHIV